jgi:hypothetical protein
MGSKADTLVELEALIKEYHIADTRVGRDICGDPNFMERMRDERLNITTKTVDKVGRYILKVRGQLELEI